MLQDKRFKNRELSIMRRIEHTNIVALRYFFYSGGEKKVSFLLISRVLQARKWNFERGLKRSKMTYFGLKMWFLSVFSLFQNFIFQLAQSYLYLIFSAYITRFFQDEVYLNLVLDLVPENLYRIARNYSKAKVCDNKKRPHRPFILFLSANDSDAVNKAIYVSIVPCISVYSFARNLSSRY